MKHTIFAYTITQKITIMRIGLYKLLAPIILSIFGLLCVHSQVTIGNDTKAADGALLQLKENDDLGANANRGLLLPRVQLTGHNLEAISKNDTETSEMYTGLTVWNVRSVEDICKGVQTWTGSKWESPMPRNENKSSYNPTSGILTDHEGNTYTTASFGTAGVWMTQNLRSRTAPGACDDTYFLDQLTAEDFSKHMWINVVGYPNKDQPGTTAPPTWTTEQGMLYTWALATNNKGGFDGLGNVDGVQDESRVEPVRRQGICPDGWHLPSISEWDALMSVLHADAKSTSPIYADYSQPGVGQKSGMTSIKSKTPLAGVLTKGASKPASEGGFDALMTGFITDKVLRSFGKQAEFWASNSYIQEMEAGAMMASAYRAYILVEEETFTPSNPHYNYIGIARRTNMFSVRCKKND